MDDFAESIAILLALFLLIILGSFAIGFGIVIILKVLMFFGFTIGS